MGGLKAAQTPCREAGLRQGMSGGFACRAIPAYHLQFGGRSGRVSWATPFLENKECLGRISAHGLILMSRPFGIPSQMWGRGELAEATPIGPAVHRLWQGVENQAFAKSAKRYPYS